jgi:hypothetical protein
LKGVVHVLGWIIAIVVSVAIIAYLMIGHYRNRDSSGPPIGGGFMEWEGRQGSGGGASVGIALECLSGRRTLRPVSGTSTSADQVNEIERALRDDDPKFVSAVNFGRFRRRRTIVGGTAFILGMIALVVWEMVSQVICVVGVVVGVAGFIAMFVALAWTILPRIRT